MIAIPLLVGIVWIATEPLRNSIRTTPEDVVSPTTTVELGLNERAYLDALGPVRMAVDPDWEPYEVIAAGKHVGIATDLIHLISTRLGMEIELVVTRDWDESLEASRDGRVHMLAFLNQTPERETWLYFTEPYFKDQNVLITRIEHDYIANAAGLSGETVALPSGTSIQERLQDEYPNLGIVVVENETEAFEAVENSTADMAIRSLTMAAYTIRKEGLFNLKVAGQLPGFENRFRIGVVKSDPMLRTILNKWIATITPQDVQQAINNHLPIEMGTEVDYNLIMWLSSIFVLLLAGGLLWNYFLRRINRRLHEQDVALRQSQEMMGYIIEHNKSAVAVLDHQLRFNYVSQKYLELFKLKGSLIRRFLHDVHPGLTDYWYQALQKALAGQVANGEEDLFVHSERRDIGLSPLGDTALVPGRRYDRRYHHLCREYQWTQGGGIRLAGEWGKIPVAHRIYQRCHLDTQHAITPVHLYQSFGRTIAWIFRGRGDGAGPAGLAYSRFLCHGHEGISR